MCYKLYTSIISIACLAGVSVLSLPVWADGEPEELTAENSGTLLPDEQGTLSEEAVATVTADGDFLLPTYLLPGETAQVERTTTVETIEDPALVSVEPIVIPTDASTPGETVIRTKTTTVTNVLSPATPIVNVSRTVTQKATPESAVKEPAPEEKPVVKTPVVKAVVVPKPADDLDEIVAEVKKPVVADDKPVRVHSAGGQLLIPLAAVPETEKTEPALPVKERVIVPSGYADYLTQQIRSGASVGFAMPHEMKITFYPKASAFSGQTLKWVRAFAWAALQDPRLVVEIRASCAEADLQDKRLALVKGVLQGVGLSSHQIIVNYTDRPVDTMLLRSIPKPEKNEIATVTKSVKISKNATEVKKW